VHTYNDSKFKHNKLTKFYNCWLTVYHKYLPDNYKHIGQALQAKPQTNLPKELATHLAQAGTSTFNISNVLPVRGFLKD
jgi:hypothetical protein